jgi:hypothetical protein
MPGSEPPEEVTEAGRPPAGRRSIRARRAPGDFPCALPPLVAVSARFGRAGAASCCRSSVVEHSLGKGEVHSSILCGSTMHITLKLITKSHLFDSAASLWPMKLPKKRSGNRPGSKPSLGHDRRQLPALNNVSPSHRSASFSFGMEGMPERRPTSSGAPTGFRSRAVERTAATCSAPGGPHVTAQARQPLGHKTGTSRGGHFDDRDGAASYKSTVRRAGPQTRECRRTDVSPNTRE